jgi:chromosome segregation ATPase
MKKIGVFIVVVILGIEVVLLVKIARSGSKDKDSIIVPFDESGFKTQLSAALQQVESLKKESESLKTSADAAAKALQVKEQELQDAIKASETLQAGVSTKFDEFQKKATEFDNQRKTEIAELNKKIETLNGEKTAMSAKLDEELKKRDATIEQLNKSVALSEKILGEERQQTADLTKQLNKKARSKR